MKNRILILLIINVFYFNYAISQIYLDSYHIEHKNGRRHSKNFNTWRSETKKKNSHYRNLSFDVKFDDNCRYVLQDPYGPGEQTRKQKVIKLCTNQNLQTKNSLRIGWCWDPEIQKICLAFYSHINHLEFPWGDEPGREHCLLEKNINTGQWVHVKMAIGKKGMFMSIDDQSVIVSRNIYSWSQDGETTFAMANSYFEYKNNNGNKKGAIQDMDFYIRNAIADVPNFPWKNKMCEYTADSIAFINTHFEFTDQGPYNYYASSRIYCSKKSASTVTNLPYEAPFTVIEPNIFVSFNASESIVLDKGFHAKSGSNFRATIYNIFPPEHIYVESIPCYLTQPVCYTVQNAISFEINLYDWQDSILLDQCSGSVIENQACCYIGENLPIGRYLAITTFSNLCETIMIDHPIKKLTLSKTNNEFVMDSIKKSRVFSNINYLSTNINIDKKVNYNSNIIKNSIFHNENFIIYPNPNSGTFNIEIYDEEFSVFSLQVINMMGNTVYQKKSIPAGKTEINIKAQPKGIYFLEVQIGEKVYTGKVVYL